MIRSRGQIRPLVRFSGNADFRLDDAEAARLSPALMRPTTNAPLAIAVGDVTLMLQYATYSVISPEGCASILWKSADNAPDAAEILGITAPRLKQLGLVDKVVNEPIGGAHRDHAAIMATLKKALGEALRQLQELPLDAMLDRREEKILAYGKFKEISAG